MRTVTVNWEEIRSYTSTVQVPDNATSAEITELCDKAARAPSWPGNPAAATRVLAREHGPRKILSVHWKDGNEFGGRVR